MCLIAFAFGVSKDYPLLFAANRDEHYSRPTLDAEWWRDHPQILGGRDILKGGTWLGISRDGRLGAVTNLPSSSEVSNKNSRGNLVKNYLVQQRTIDQYKTRLSNDKSNYAPYNFIAFDGVKMLYSSNSNATKLLPYGIYSISNAPLGTSWPKVQFAETIVRSVSNSTIPENGLFELLANSEDQKALDNLKKYDERQSRIFINNNDFGTRSSTVITISREGNVQFIERNYSPDAKLINENQYNFNLIP